MVAPTQVVPIRVDTLWVGPETRTAEPWGHFERLPYNDGLRDVNAGTPFLAEHVTSSPFEDASAWLPEGVHLHWALPRYLTTGRHRPGDDAGSAFARVQGVDFPLVPNRWLVRTPRGEWWLVESDYVHPELEHQTQPGVSYLLSPEQQAHLRTTAPARFVGRQVRLRDWVRAGDEPRQWLPGVTAVGWGDPSFHGFYPHCWSILGFHDPEPDEAPDAGGAYDVYGYYSDPALDPVAQFVERFHPGGAGPQGEGVDELRTAIDDEFGWRTRDTGDFPWQKPAGILCVGRAGRPRGDDQVPEPDASITVALSGINSLASHMSHLLVERLPQGVATFSVEEAKEAFEAVVLGPLLDLERPDARAQLTEARHGHGFVAHPGGSRWTIRSKGPGLTADVSHAPAAVHGTAPDHAAGVLAELNRTQQSLDRLSRTQDSLSAQLYADWCTYLTCTYPRDGADEDRPDPDQVRHHIELDRLATLEATTAQWQALLARTTALTHDVVSALAVDDLAALAVTVDDVTDWEALNHALDVLGVTGLDPATPDPTDAEAWRTHLVTAANGAVLHDPVRPDAVLAGPMAPVEDSLARWLAQPSPTPSDVLEESAPVRDHVFRRDDVATARHQQAWLEHLTDTAITWHRAVRARAALEIAACGGLRTVAKTRHHLEVHPGPRFWAPRDPVVLVHGPSVTRSPRAHAGPIRSPGSEGRDVETFPESTVIALGADPTSAVPRAMTADDSPPGSVRSEIASLCQTLPGGNFTGNPAWERDWHPVYVDWAASLEGHAAPSDSARYAPDVVTDRYRLRQGEPDLTRAEPLSGEGSGEAGHSPAEPGTPERRYELSGRSHLTGHATAELRSAGTQGGAGNPAAEVDPAAGPETDTEGPPPERLSRVLADWAVDYTEDNEADLQTFSLTGFNAGLLGHRPMLPLPVSDPLAFAESRTFAERVARAVGRHSTSSPTPLGPFVPLRGGRLQLERVRVVDSFGRIVDLQLDTSASSRSRFTWGTHSGRPQLDTSLELPPRVVPPARLAVRWLSATTPTLPGQPPDEAHDHPSTGPVCGWLTPNALDGRIMVHRASGEAIGSVDDAGTWHPAPGRDRFLPPDDIDNPGLRAVVLQLLHESGYERGRTVDTMMDSLEGIEPDSHAQHRALGLLLGRPVAVVRASLRLQLLGSPPANRAWQSQRAELAGAPPDTAGLLDVEFPVRIGEPGQLNDGVVGFWVEARDTAEDRQGNGTHFIEPLVTPQRVPDEAGGTRDSSGAESSSGHLRLRLDDDAVHLTVLMDPRGTLHATSGILPTSVIDIPPEQFAPALASISVSFLTAPLLCDPGKIQVAVPSEPGYAWSWLQRSPDGWSRVPASQIDSPSTRATLTAPQHIREGWLTLAPAPGTPAGGALEGGPI